MIGYTGIWEFRHMAKFPSFLGRFWSSPRSIQIRWDPENSMGGRGFKSGIGLIKNNISGLYFNGRAGAYAPKIFEMRLEICPFICARLVLLQNVKKIFFINPSFRLRRVPPGLSFSTNATRDLSSVTWTTISCHPSPEQRFWWTVAIVISTETMSASPDAGYVPVAKTRSS